MTRVLLVTSWDTPCGIADYAASLKRYTELADPEIEVTPSADALDPVWAFGTLTATAAPPVQVVHLNHHDALHSRWTADHVRQLRDRGYEVVVTYHDTRADGNSAKLHQLHNVASSTIVHEPVADLAGVLVWPQGIPDAALEPAHFGGDRVYGYDWVDAWGNLQQTSWKAYPQQPVLGTVGFNFPWKNYDRLAAMTGEEGWALLIIAHGATKAEQDRWAQLNPHTYVVDRFQQTPMAVNWLAGCDATAFMYECQNTGTSGAIRLGLAARRSVIALAGCRQFRDLLELQYGGVLWVNGWEALRTLLQDYSFPPRYDNGARTVAEAWSWRKRGRDHAALYRMLAGLPIEETQGTRV